MEIMKLFGRVFSSGVSEKGRSSDDGERKDGNTAAEGPAITELNEATSKPATTVAPFMRYNFHINRIINTTELSEVN